jgi:hypothetical protein
MSRSDLLAAIAADAALERSDFLAQAGRQLQGFIDQNRERINELGGLVLIDEDPDYLSVAPDGSFRSRTRFLDEDAGEWVSETEVIESAAELVELYNPADVLAAFADAVGSHEGAAPETESESIQPLEPVMMPTPFDDAILGRVAGSQPAWQDGEGAPLDEASAARGLYELALAFQDRSQRVEANLFDQFTEQAAPFAMELGSVTIVDDDDERLTIGSDGSLHAEVLPEDAPDTWRSLESAAELVEYYDPTDVFGDIADALAEAYPAVAADAGG